MKILVIFSASKYGLFKGRRRNCMIDAMFYVGVSIVFFAGLVVLGMGMVAG